jgi:LacI family transcriptional regulator, repressor for deo operon, udp, cdd, tsx, nupC, and nupG
VGRGELLPGDNRGKQSKPSKQDERGKRVTIRAVARAAGVSASTVSVVLNGHHRAVGIREATRAAVVEASERLGYRPNDAARSLRRQHSNVLTLLVQDLANPCFVDIAVAARAAAAARGYEVNVVDAGGVDAELRALDRLRGDGSDGVIVATGRHGTRPAALDLLRDLVGRGLPAVVLLDRSPDPRVPAIRVDVETGAYVAVQHLLSLGHRRIAHLALQGSRPIAEEQTSQGDRYRGYRRALADAGIEADPAWLVRGTDTLAGGQAMMAELLSRSAQQPTAARSAQEPTAARSAQSPTAARSAQCPTAARSAQRPTAALVYNDLTAIGALRALRDAGVRVPEDMAVVGTDGIELGRFTSPSLTTIEHPREELARLAVAALCELVGGGQASETERVLPARLVVRESCGALLVEHPTRGRAEPCS